jgi:raffinose/stachyose/melibiose transport system permease protein
MTRYSWRTGLLEIVMIAVTAAFAVPLWLLISTAFRTAPQIAQSAWGLPDLAYLGNFRTAWDQAGLGQAFVNSIVITVVSIAVLVLLGASASYFFARSLRRWSNRLFLLVVVGVMIPGQIGVMPLYRTFAELKMAGSTASVIVFSVGTLLPFTVLLYTSFMRQLPPDYEEAARIDGASSWQAFRMVVVPLLLPVTGTVVILDGVAIWNDFFTPLIYLNGTPNATLPVQIFSFVGDQTANWGAIFAGLLMASLPLLILYFIFQRYVIRGFSGGLRG